ncbi:protein KINESIN LIGHT CHAIN-RELATED 2-like [Ananas comosus]|uniref:Protein KINESIN LIGHT CHAIN-RELATED 2-like n=2 Tax=Ananas comosus TaxID=4615 RepID=A0A6P5FMI9_ANACO|nr:protein KINESIN LIGHT CHAIN-RELATED 2-like [Ananas comosus]
MRIAPLSSYLFSLSRTLLLSPRNLLLPNLFSSHLPLHSPPPTSSPLPSPSSLSVSLPSPRAFQTLPWPPPAPPSFDSASTMEELLVAFKAMESSVESGGGGGGDERKLGVACLKLAERMSGEGSGNFEKGLAFALRALKIFEKSDGGWSLPVAEALCVVGSISCKMKRFDESLESLNTAVEILGALERGDANVCIAAHDQLARTKTALGRRWEALVDQRRSFELKVAILEPNCRELGCAYKDTAEAYTLVLEFKEALPLCLKALEIHKQQFGLDSAEVAKVRQLLGVIYIGLGENEEALRQSELSRRIFGGLELVDELIQAEIDAANILILLGRLDEATSALKMAIQKAEKESEARAFVLVTMAKALCCEEKFGEARRCVEIACGILDKKETSCPSKVVEAYAEVSMLYESMSEFETSLSMMKRTLAMLQKLPEMQHMEGSISARIGWLLLFTKRVPQAVPYLESAIEKLKNSFGPKHFGLGFAYKHLGQAYLEMNQLQLAVKFLSLAKDIIEISFGTQHEDSIDTNQCLANAYGIMGSYAIAMDFQQQVVDGWEAQGPSAADEVREAHRLLEQLKKKAQGSRSAVFPANSLPLPPSRK